MTTKQESPFSSVLSQPDAIVKEWSNGEDRRFSICHIVGVSDDWYTGYVMFPDRPLRGDTIDEGMAIYVPVRNGISFDKTDPETGRCVYGFSCADPVMNAKPGSRDIAWLTAECERLEAAITIAQKYEDRYWADPSCESRRHVIFDYWTELDRSLEGLDGGDDGTDDLGFAAKFNIMLGLL
jgi:hypothetical protein